MTVNPFGRTSLITTLVASVALAALLTVIVNTALLPTIIGSLSIAFLMLKSTIGIISNVFAVMIYL